MNGAKDGNGATTATGVSSADGFTPVRLRVDPVTGFLLVKITPISDFGTRSPAVKIDENGVRIGRGVTNDASLSIKPFLSDPNNPGQLLLSL